jgi:hypothetical protein
MAEPGDLGRRIAAQLGEVTLHKVRDAGFANARANGARIAAGRSVLALRDSPLVQGNAALVIAAGPSLHRTNVAAQLAASGFDGIVVATESAMAYCLRHGIVPDLIVTLDPHATRIVRWFGDPRLTHDDLMRDDYYSRQDLDPQFADNQLRANAELVDLVNTHGPRMRAAVCSSAPAAVVERVYESGMAPYWWNPYYDDYDTAGSLTRQIHAMNGLPCLNAGGNVGAAAWVVAHAILGKTRIGLLGMDLGYYADTPYERTQYFYEIRDLVGADRLDEVYVRFHNAHVNADFYTDPAYLWYRDSFLEMARDAECETVNCTGGGILFGEGVSQATLPDFVGAACGGHLKVNPTY